MTQSRAFAALFFDRSRDYHSPVPLMNHNGVTGTVIAQFNNERSRRPEKKQTVPPRLQW